MEHRRIKVKVTVAPQTFPHLSQYKLSGPITQLWHKLGSLLSINIVTLEWFYEFLESVKS